MKDMMVDLETLGNGENKCIVQIGACYFDRSTGAVGKTFKCNIDAASATKEGFQIDAPTVYWWLNQSDAARASILADPKLPIREAMANFSEFAAEAKCIWSHATFDFVTLSQTYQKLGIAPKYAYRTARDIRTLMDLFNITVDKTSRQGTHHDGLDDALHQVKYCMEAFTKLEQLKLANQLISSIKGKK